MGDLTTVKQLLSIPTSDTTQDAQLSALLLVADPVVRSYLKRPNISPQVVVTEYRDGANAVDLALYNYPVYCVTTTGNLAANSSTVTGIASGTANLVVGMPAVSLSTPAGASAIPNAATIASIDSSSQVTLSAAATQTLAATQISFGLAVWYDPAGYSGDGPGSAPGGPFAAGTQLLIGQDYNLERDQPDGSSKSGVIRRVGLAGYGAPWGFWGGYGYADQGGRRGGLTARLPPTWGNTYGGIKVVSTVGFAAANLPAEITYAVNTLTCFLYRQGGFGGNQVSTSESYEGYSFGLAAIQANPELGTLRQVLGRHMNRCL